jgi:hypothetical protein
VIADEFWRSWTAMFEVIQGGLFLADLPVQHVFQNIRSSQTTLNLTWDAASRSVDIVAQHAA